MNKEPIRSRYIYSVEIVIEERDSGKALEKLTSLLNHRDIDEYKIISGKPMHSDSVVTARHLREHLLSRKKIPSQTAGTADTDKDLMRWIQQYLENGTLVRIQVVKELGVKLSMPCRILHFDAEQENLSVYHVDEKKVYLLRLSEIDDILE